jgi:putative transposase
MKTENLLGQAGYKFLNYSPGKNNLTHQGVSLVESLCYINVMGLRKENFATGEFYHIYNRGNSKQKIFLDDNDRDRFLKLLYLCNSEKNIRFREDIIEKKIDVWDFDRGKSLASLGAWVLMPNHFHVLICLPPRSLLGGEGISLFMKKLCTGYSMYFNKKYQRTGKLFEGVFKSTHLVRDEQLKYIFSYIHLNPIKLIDPQWKEKGIKNTQQAINFLQKYRWSSYKDYIGEDRPENKILFKKDFPTYFPKKKDFNKEILEWLNFKEL